MKGKKCIWAAGVLLLSATLWNCGGSSSPVAVVAPVDALYVGSAVCGTCHQEIYDTFINSAHPYKLNKVLNDTVPTYPFSTIVGALEMVTDEDGVTDNTLGTPTTYADISYVIGGFGWKARWMDADGFIVTGSKVQYNLENGSIVAYHDNEVDKPYNCGNCHTTGWQHYDAALNDNRQDDLPGMDGTFAEQGIQCESCHGGGSAHVASQDARDIVKIAAARTTTDFLAADMGLGLAVACSECHTRDGEKDYPAYVSGYNTAFPAGPQEGGRIIASGGLLQHHEQFDELQGINPDTGNPLGKHQAASVTCNTCHDPHKTVKYQDQTGETGLVKECLDCHGAGKPFEITMPDSGMALVLDCIDCHMPLIAKNAVSHAAVGSGPLTGDIKGHIFKIKLSTDQQLTADGKYFYPWLTKDFACLTCHNGVSQFDLSTTDITAYTFHQATTTGNVAALGIDNDYVGSNNCAFCHSDYYDTFRNSGHPYKVNKIINDTIPTYPFSDIDGALERIADDNGETDNTLGTPATYADISYVIGGFGWKARWMDADGFIVTGSAVQYNLENDTMSAYHNDETDKPFNCGNCHTTGWQHFDAVDNNSRQDGLPGMDGTFAEQGIQCESCHGAGRQHMFSGDPVYITRTADARITADFMADDMGYGLAVACSECHTRDGEKDYPTYVSGAEGAGYSDGGANEGGRIIVSGGLAQHHEQYDELLGIDPANVAGGGLGKHLLNDVTCQSCHDPHKTVKYQDQTGESGVADCSDCHSTVGFTIANHGVLPDNCILCHMPKLAKSAISTGTNRAGKTLGDIKSHIFKIDLTKTVQVQDNPGTDYMYPWLVPDYTCGTCHTDPAAFVIRLNASYGGKIHN